MGWRGDGAVELCDRASSKVRMGKVWWNSVEVEGGGFTRLPVNPITLKAPVASSYHKTEDFSLKRVINKRKRKM